ncbi:hypothetical protein QQP08_013638 [Theobroma cacao]|nr:hypothetical protein QQP08_013455 [Theobroma cacao]WRX21150.1 hypothetical protein QQP08_013637 [Theobroma cacao]WRX21151.1 hypothetical protein QQP08_013638 [Theobroma cacao]
MSEHLVLCGDHHLVTPPGPALFGSKQGLPEPYGEDGLTSTSESLTVPGIPREVQLAELISSEDVERLLEAEFDECNNETHENENVATIWPNAILIARLYASQFN